MQRKQDISLFHLNVLAKFITEHTLQAGGQRPRHDPPAGPSQEATGPTAEMEAEAVREVAEQLDCLTQGERLVKQMQTTISNAMMFYVYDVPCYDVLKSSCSLPWFLGGAAGLLDAG